MASTFGAHGAGRVRQYLASPSASNLYGLGDVVLSPLMPYIRAIETQGQAKGERSK